MSLYVPSGFPRLQLAASSLRLAWRPNVSASRLRERLERWERARGNLRFEARHLEKLPTDFGYELANVYVALREKFPSVEVDYIDFSYPQCPQPHLAGAGLYPQAYPALHRFAIECGAANGHELVHSFSDGDDDLADFDPALAKEIGWLETSYERRRNFSATGAIELHPCLSHPRCYATTIEDWQANHARQVAAGRPPRIISNYLTPLSFIFVHEFGHLVDSVVLESGSRVANNVYGALSKALSPDETPRIPRPSQWSRHLINYPTCEPPSALAPHAGGRSRQAIIRKGLKQHLASKLGSYAPYSRYEVFAEAFALSYSARDPELARTLAGFRRSLVDAGIARSRRR